MREWVSSSETSRAHNYTTHHRLHLKFVEKRQHDPVTAYRLERNGAIDVPFQTWTRNTISVDWLNVFKYLNTLLLPCLQGVKERNWHRLLVHSLTIPFSPFILFLLSSKFPDWIFQMLRERSKEKKTKKEKEMAIRENYIITSATDARSHGMISRWKISKGRHYFRIQRIWFLSDAHSRIPLKLPVKMNQMK